jgi:hypothetical protein
LTSVVTATLGGVMRKRVDVFGLAVELAQLRALARAGVDDEVLSVGEHFPRSIPGAGSW